MNTDPPARQGESIYIANEHQRIDSDIVSRLAGPSGLPGVGISYALHGCYVHTGNRASTTGLALSSFQATYTTTVADLCKARCALGSFIFMGVVNVGATADCWCGNAISIVTR